MQLTSTNSSIGLIYALKKIFILFNINQKKIKTYRTDIMRVFITGGAGFIGYNCCNFFFNKNFKVKTIDNLSRKTSKINYKALKKNKKIITQILDVKDYSKLEKSILSFKPNLIINCAGQVAVTTSIVNPRLDFETNVIGTLNLLEILRKNKLNTKFIHLSTNKVYGNLNYLKLKTKKKRYEFKKIKNGIDENFNLDFHSPYGCSKGSADQYVIDYKRIYNLDTYVIRQSCIYGPYQFGLQDQGWVAWFMICSILNKKISIYGNGKQVRDILHINDLIELFYKIYKNKKHLNSNVFNCGGGIKNSLSILDLCEYINKLNTNKIKYNFKKERKGDQKIFISNNNLLKKNFKWYPKISKFSGIKSLHKWMLSNIDDIKKV